MIIDVTCDDCGHAWQSHAASGRTECRSCGRRVYIPTAIRRAAGGSVETATRTNRRTGQTRRVHARSTVDLPPARAPRTERPHPRGAAANHVAAAHDDQPDDSAGHGARWPYNWSGINCRRRSMRLRAHRRIAGGAGRGPLSVTWPCRHSPGAASRRAASRRSLCRTRRVIIE
jgi:ribosomal protein S27E